MSKIFEFSGGSYIDKISGAVGVNTLGEFAQTEKGLAYRIDETNSSARINFPNFINCGTVHSIVIPFKINRITSHNMLVGHTTGTAYYISVRDNDRVYYNLNGAGDYITWSPDHNWHQLIITRNVEDLKFYIDGILIDTVTIGVESGTDFEFDIIGNWSGYSLPIDGNILNVSVYDHVFTPDEIAKSYSEFLNAAPQTKAITDNLSYPKPFDLSHLVDSRIGNPDADGAFDMFKDYDFTDGNWDISSGTIDSSNSFTPAAIGGIYTGSLYPYNLVKNKTYIINYDINIIGGTGSLTESDGLGSIVLRKEIAALSDGNNVGTVIYTSIYDIGGIYIRLTGAFPTTVNSLSINEWNGEELIPDPNVGFVANEAINWSVYGTNTIEQDGNAVKISYVDSTTMGYVWLRPVTGTTYKTISLRKLRVTLRVKVNAGSNIDVSLYSLPTGTIDAFKITNTEYQTIILEGYCPGDPRVLVYTASTNEVAWVEILSIMEVTGLVAAYNMVPTPEKTLVDISGNGNIGDILHGSISVQGMLFDRDFGGVAITAINLGTVHSIVFRIKDHVLGTSIMPFAGTSISNYIWMTVNAFRYRANAGNLKDITFNPISNLWSDFVLTRSGTTITLYQDGVYLGSETLDADDDFTLDNLACKSTYNGAEVADIRIFNYALSEAEAIAYHNQFAKRIQTKDVLALDHGAGDNI